MGAPHVSALGFNIKKGELWHCVLSGTRREPVYVSHNRDRFDPDQPRTALANYFKQTFGEVISRTTPDRLAYRVSLDANSADQVAYLTFPFGILNLVAHDLSLPISEYVSQSFSKKALGFAGNKFEACDEMIAGSPDKWGDPEKLAALAAWMALDA
jgi:Holliday junction resolvasome RuvABC endonuclease subunit